VLAVDHPEIQGVAELPVGLHEGEWR
jgi:hypothetical protein